MYYITNGSMYVNIVRIRYIGADYVKAHVQYFSKPGRTLLTEERNCIIPKKCFNFWLKE